MTMSFLSGRSRSKFFRLLWRTPRRRITEDADDFNIRQQNRVNEAALQVAGLLQKTFRATCTGYLFMKTTMRLVLVPLAMLSTSEQLAVVVNFSSLIRMRRGSKPGARPQGR